MGKNQSKYTNNKGEGQETKRKDKRSVLSKPIKWLAKRFNTTKTRIGVKEDQLKEGNCSTVLPGDLKNNFSTSTEVCKRRESCEGSCRTASDNESIRENLSMVGLDDDNINVIRNNDLSVSFFLETNQNPGCSHWSEAMLQSRYHGIRKINPKTKNEIFGMRSRCSKLNPSAAYDKPENVCEQSDSHAHIEDIDENVVQSPCEGPRVCIDTQDTGVQTARESDSALEICCINDFSNSIVQHVDIVGIGTQDDEAEKTIDGLFSHLCYFSPKHIMEGSLSLADIRDHLQLPMIEIITEEKTKHIVAHILINHTLAKEYAIRGLSEMHTIRMCEALMMQLNWWNSNLPVSWFEFFMKVSKTSFHRFISGQAILERRVLGDAQCSFSYAKKEGWC